VAERRLVSVLIADVVAFTSLSEQRDSETVRELLADYFEPSREVIGRYGGVVEKFMATPYGGLGNAGRARGRCRAP
jgi:class 3 adenylate cyclase